MPLSMRCTSTERVLLAARSSMAPLTPVRIAVNWTNWTGWEGGELEVEVVSCSIRPFQTVSAEAPPKWPYWI